MNDKCQGHNTDMAEHYCEHGKTMNCGPKCEVPVEDCISCSEEWEAENILDLVEEWNNE